MPDDSQAALGGARKITPMDLAHVMDFAPLHLGHPILSKHVVQLVDLEVYVHGLQEIRGSKLPIVMIMLAHGFANKAIQMEPMACGLIGEINRLERENGHKVRDVLVVTMDQRNHGLRRRVRDGVQFENNPMRLIHMECVVTGGVQDHELVMKCLPAFLFPEEEREVAEFMSAGVSMGGHITWRLLREDPRIRVGVPLITIPNESLADHLLTRAKTAPVPTSHLPASTREWFYAPSPPERYRGKKILSLHGQLDKLIPPERGDEKLGAIMRAAERPEDVQQWCQPGRGHVISPEMVQRTAAWFYRWGFV